MADPIFIKRCNPAKHRSMSDHMNMMFWPGLKPAAQRIADREHGGNLRAYINTLVQRDVQRDARRSKKEKA